MHEHEWRFVKQQFDLGIDRVFYVCKCGEEKVTEYDLIEEEYLDASK
ncbi:hypothetical protein LCGC14_0455370 [marine sediment metagenome]|uniref:Uncharacterized protein n=1 Tax=marine sediment metagenome TaxID=412755 RepID=A0A0F9VQL6_9ZZZZ